MDATTERAPPSYLPFNEARSVIIGILLAMFLAALDQTIIATALPTIGRDLNDVANLSWTITAYLLTSTVVASLYGKLSDIHGRRAMMLTAIGIFIAGSVVCALAPTMLVLVLGRALQGLGGGGIMPLSQVIVADVSAPRERGRFQALLGGVWIGAGVGGPVIGGLIAQHLSWSLIFWINLPLGAAAAYLTNRALKRLPRNDRWHELDIIGAALMMLAAISALLALTWGGTRYSWGSPQIVGLFGLAVLFALAFRWRIGVAKEPYLPLPILRNPVVLTGAASSACAMGVAIGLTAFVPFYYQLVHKLSVTNSGFALIPLALMTTPGSIMAGRAMMYLTHYKRITLACMTLAMLATAFLAWRPQASPWIVMAALALVGTGVGSVYPLATVCIQNSVQPYQMGTATGVMNFFRALTASLAVAVMGAIMLAGFGVAPDRAASAEALVTAGLAGEGAAGVFRWVFAAATAFLAIGVVAMICLPEHPLRGGSGRSGK
jgi:MFS family permease